MKVLAPLIGFLLPALALAGPADDARARLQALVGDVPLSQARTADDWRVRLEAEVVATWQADPELAASLWEARPIRTRAGFLRFVGPLRTDPRTAPVFLDRYLHGGEGPEVRRALVEALGVTGGDWDEAVVALLPREPDEEVRGVMVAVLKHARAEVAWEGLRLALADPSPGVRAEAAFTVGRRNDGAPLVPDLLRLLEDADPGVRAQAARSLGWIRAPEAVPALRRLVSDPQADVRLRALRALDRIDPSAARSLELAPLRADPDPRVSRLAARIAEG